MEDKYIDIFSKFDSISFDDIISATYKQMKEAIWLSDESSGLSKSELINYKEETQRNLKQLVDNKNLSDLYDSIRKPFSNKEIYNKSSKLSSILLTSFKDISSSESEFNILNFFWGLDIDTSLSIFYDPKHSSKIKVGYMDFGKSIQWIPFEIDIAEYFGSFIKFEKEDANCLLMESDHVILLYKALKLQFTSILKNAIKMIPVNKLFKEKYYYVSEFDSDSILIIKT